MLDHCHPQLSSPEYCSRGALAGTVQCPFTLSRFYLNLQNKNHPYIQKCIENFRISLCGIIKKNQGTRTGDSTGQREKPGMAPVMSVWLLIVLSGQLTRVPCAMGPSPSVDNAVSHTSLLRLIKNRQIDVTSMVELYLTLICTAPPTHAGTHTHEGTCVQQDSYEAWTSILSPHLEKK